jgi:hypothetical protein
MLEKRFPNFFAAFFSGTILGDALGVVKACTRFFLNENGVEKIDLKEERKKHVRILVKLNILRQLTIDNKY